MTKIDARISDPDLKEWLASKQNKSQTTREALLLLYKQELSEKEPKQVEVKIIG